MRITVLAYNLVDSGGLSVGRNITALLPKIGLQHQYLILVPEDRGYDEHHGNDRVIVKRISRKGLQARIAFDLFTLPVLVREFNSDLVLALGNLGLSRCWCRQAVLIHQPQVAYPSRQHGNPGLKDRLRLWAVKRRIKSCLGSTDLVFCQTPVMRQRFSEAMGYPIEKIRIMPNAVSEFAKKAAEPAAPPVLAAKNGTFNLFLLARYMPHKNIEVLIELFSRCRKELKDVRCIITISEEQGKKAKMLLDQIKKNNLEKQIINVGSLKQEELAAYFCHSDAFFFPTLLESFSGTYLEAMHFGLPIITSDLDFARYVCEDAAVYFDPWNPKAIVEKILMVKNSEQVRKQLVQIGKDRVALFFKSWEQIVTEMLQEVEKL